MAGRRNTSHVSRSRFTGSLAGADFIMTWRTIVGDYTSRKLTNPGDRLVAISAVDRELQRVSSHEYLAGLWKHALPRLLQWAVRSRKSSKKQPEYTAPSWSWVSVIGEIGYNAHTRDTISDLEVVNVSLETDPCNNMFGKITYGVLLVRGQVAEVVIRPHRIGYHSVGMVTCCDPALESIAMGLGSLDLPADDFNQGIWNERLLLLLVDKRSGSGLILRRMGGAKYCRVGGFSFGWHTPKPPQAQVTRPKIPWVKSTIEIE